MSDVVSGPTATYVGDLPEIVHHVMGRWEQGETKGVPESVAAGLDARSDFVVEGYVAHTETDAVDTTEASPEAEETEDDAKEEAKGRRRGKVQSTEDQPEE